MKGKTQKGITLVALVITVVVLLILAAVAIAAINDTGVIDKTNNAATKFEEKQGEENTHLNDYEATINNYITGGNGSGDIVAVEPSIGQYVKYDVSYTDMYQGTTYTSTNGWRYLGKDSSNNHLLISTAIPVQLYYSFNDNGENAKWWDTNTALSDNVRAINGLTNNFAKIPYTQTESGTSVSTPNTAIGRFAETEATAADGTTYTAIGDYFKSSTYASKIVNVRTLTLEELNRAVNSANGNTNREETSTSAGFKELGNTASGLFDLKDLTGYTADYYYFLASRVEPASGPLCYVGAQNLTGEEGVGTFYDVSFAQGVRPVVVLSSTVQFTDTNTDNILEIN